MSKCVCGLGEDVLHGCGVIPSREGVGGTFPEDRARPITERMAEAKTKMRRLSGMGAPRCYYLAPKDFDEFATTKPPTVEAMFALPLGSRPSPMTCLGFEGIAVRQTVRKPDRLGVIRSTLICTRGRSVSVRHQ